jgi:hypothetical protein
LYQNPATNAFIRTVLEELGMQDPRESSGHWEPKDNDFQDAHFHDEEDDVPIDDINTHRARLPARRKPARRPTPRRYEYED